MERKRLVDRRSRALLVSRTPTEVANLPERLSQVGAVPDLSSQCDRLRREAQSIHRVALLVGDGCESREREALLPAHPDRPADRQLFVESTLSTVAVA